jgi:hypothetical protein
VLVTSQVRLGERIHFFRTRDLNVTRASVSMHLDERIDAPQDGPGVGARREKAQAALSAPQVERS